MYSTLFVFYDAHSRSPPRQSESKRGQSAAHGPITPPLRQCRSSLLPGVSKGPPVSGTPSRNGEGEYEYGSQNSLTDRHGHCKYGTPVLQLHPTRGLHAVHRPAWCAAEWDDQLDARNERWKKKRKEKERNQGRASCPRRRSYHDDTDTPLHMMLAQASRTHSRHLLFRVTPRMQRHTTVCHIAAVLVVAPLVQSLSGIRLLLLRHMRADCQ